MNLDNTTIPQNQKWCYTRTAVHCLTALLYGAIRFIKTYRTHAIITRDLYIFIPFFTAVYIVEWFVLQTIYVLNKEILQYLSLKSVVYYGLYHYGSYGM